MFSFIRKNKFLKTTPKPHNVLLVETNGCHGEVVGGYVKYFQDLGYNVYVLVTDVIKKENPFCRLNFSNIFSVKFKEFSKLLVSKNLDKYDHIFVMSSVNYTNGEHSVADLYPDLKKHKSVFYVHHNSPYIYKYYRKSDKKRNIMLGRFKNTVYLNPHLFGDYTLPVKRPETIFVSVGGINPNRKNHTMLLHAIEELDKQNLNFTVLVVGSGSIKHLNPNVKKHIKLLGHLDYDEMYDNVERANFFLPLLDNKNPEHTCYIKTQVTGSAQLIYGFRKIPVIHKKFASFYGFNDKNAVIYQDLAKGMKQAISMSAKDYDKYVKQMDKTATAVYKKSLENLKDLLDA